VAARWSQIGLQPPRSPRRSRLASKLRPSLFGARQVGVKPSAGSRTSEEGSLCVRRRAAFALRVAKGEPMVLASQAVHCVRAAHLSGSGSFIGFPPPPPPPVRTASASCAAAASAAAAAAALTAAAAAAECAHQCLHLNSPLDTAGLRPRGWLLAATAMAKGRARPSLRSLDTAEGAAGGRRRRQLLPVARLPRDRRA